MKVTTNNVVTTDPVTNPSHYVGRHGLEAVEAIKNFAASTEYEEGFY